MLSNTKFKPPRRYVQRAACSCAYTRGGTIDRPSPRRHAIELDGVTIVKLLPSVRLSIRDQVTEAFDFINDGHTEFLGGPHRTGRGTAEGRD